MCWQAGGSLPTPRLVLARFANVAPELLNDLSKRGVHGFEALNSGAANIKMDHGHDPVQFRAVKTVSKGKLKAQMLAYFREVEATGEPLIVTDHGRAVLEIRPAIPKRSTTTLVTELRALAKPAAKIDEEEQLKPLPWEDWEVERKDDRNPW